MPMRNPMHPGEMIRDMLEARAADAALPPPPSITEMARQLGVARTTLSRLLHGRNRASARGNVRPYALPGCRGEAARADGSGGHSVLCRRDGGQEGGGPATPPGPPCCADADALPGGRDTELWGLRQAGSAVPGVSRHARIEEHGATPSVSRLHALRPPYGSGPGAHRLERSRPPDAAASGLRSRSGTARSLRGAVTAADRAEASGKPGRRRMDVCGRPPPSYAAIVRIP